MSIRLNVNFGDSGEGGIRQGTGFVLFFSFSNNATEMHFGNYRIVPRNVRVVVYKFQSIHGPNWPVEASFKLVILWFSTT